jgi:hypothetical protein
MDLCRDKKVVSVFVRFRAPLQLEKQRKPKSVYCLQEAIFTEAEFYTFFGTLDVKKKSTKCFEKTIELLHKDNDYHGMI